MAIVRIWGEGPKAHRRENRPKFLRRYRNPTSVETRRLDEQKISLIVGNQLVEILTPPAVARKLGCSEPRVIQLIGESKLPATKLGRVWLVLASDLEEYISAKQLEIEERYPFIRETSSVRRRTD